MPNQSTAKINLVLAALILVNQPAWAGEKAKPAAAQVTTPQVVHFTKAQLFKYYKVYQDPSVRQFRLTLNDYLKGKCSPTINDVLKPWSKEYYKSKFVVLAVDPGVLGGNFLTIIFEDKPDQVFTVWMYRPGKDKYELRSIEKRKMTDEQLKAMKIMYRPFLTDRVHCI